MKSNTVPTQIKKINIVFLVHTYALGGLENVVTNLVNTLDPQQYRCTILSFAPLAQVSHRVNLERVQLISLNKKAGNDLGSIYRIYRFFQESKADIVQTHNWGTVFEGLIAAKLARVPCLVHAEHGTIESKKRNRWIQRALWQWTNQVVCVSETHRRQLVDVIGYPREKIKPIFNGVDTTRFSPMPAEKTAIRKKMGLGAETICIGTLGSFRTVKNQALLLSAADQVLKITPNVHLVFVGEGPLKVGLMAEADKLRIRGQVHFLGARTDIPELLNAFDIFVLPSLMEGMPISVLEAMSCGIPVVASAVGGLPEVIEDGKSGLLFPSKDPTALAAVLSGLIADKEKRLALGQEGRRRVLSSFSVEKMVGKYHALYRSLLADTAV